MTLPRTNTFAGLSLILDRLAERRDELDWVAEQAASEQARYLLLDALGETYLLPGNEALRWLNAGERKLLADAPASFLGFAQDRPHFLLSVEDADLARELEPQLGPRRLGLREAGLLLPSDEAGLFAY